MIRVLMVHCEFLPQSSGVARHMEGLARALSDRGDIALTILAQRLAGYPARGYEVDGAGFKTLYAQMLRCDIVHVHGARTVISTVALRLARLLGKPTVFTPHCYYQGGDWLYRMSKRLWDWGVERSSLHHADAVILLHSGWRQNLSELGFDPRRIEVIPNCIDASAVRARLAANLPRRLAGRPALLSVGRIDKIKRLDDVIGALLEPGLEEAELHIVGQGDDLDRLQAQVSGLGLGRRVHFLGWRDDDDTAAMVRGCDVMVLASEREGLPTVFLESLLAQTPMAVSDIDGNRAIADMVGWRHVFTLGDRRALAACVLECAAASVPPAMADTVERLFSWQSRAADVAALYDDILRQALTPAPALSPEFEALRYGVALALDPSMNGQILGQALARVGTWDDVIAGVQRHRVSALMLEALKKMPAAAIAPARMQALLWCNQRNALRGLTQIAELARLLRAFQAQGINVLVLKGVALSQRLYGDPFRRGIGDMDLLIARADFVPAHALLVENGYVRQDSLATHPPSGDLVALMKDCAYVRDGGHVVELHLQLSERNDCPEWDFSVLWRDRAEIRVQSLVLPTLSDRVLAPYLLAHGARHCWDRLCWLADIAVLFKDKAVRARALDDCARLGWKNEAGHADALIGLWLGGETATSAGVSVQMRWFMQAFFSERRWLERPRRGTAAWMSLELRRRLWGMRLSGDWRRNIAAVKRALRNPVDEALIPLPAPLTFLYPLLRPVGWVLRNFIRRGR